MYLTDTSARVCAQASGAQPPLGNVDFLKALLANTAGPSADRELRHRFPRFGANGLYPGRQGEPSPIQPDQVLTAVAFLRMFTPTKRAYYSSYYLKHAAKNWGGRVGLCAYVSNGALILAALMLGLVIKPYRGWLNPNAAIGISKRDFRRFTGVYE
ncbi:hypothetical protein [Bradyrhizobium sp. 150]|uniref:hypothetical protein n=1 Tax=Bradyrhizobium sp. 150 TaxID=2782625 RepID=UPI001FF7745D|nr:hypothetical protein [Bradyrhizobium sp. 150]MCK1677763.1 hypothetical protein [Bradyrhizobium sp. 150]